jgi:hypothetical protein
MARQRASRRAKYRIALKLDREWDADLVEWLQTIPDGQRSAAVREAIRRGLGLAIPVEPTLDLEAIRRVVADELARSLAGLRLDSGSHHAEAPADDAEARYGAQLDRMLGGLSQGQTHDPEDT